MLLGREPVVFALCEADAIRYTGSHAKGGRVRPATLILALCAAAAGVVMSQDGFESDSFATSAGELKITFLGHASLLFEQGGKVVHVDPWGSLADYTKLPKADLILVTHEHYDHLDPAAIRALRTSNTVVVMTSACVGRMRDGVVLKNGETRTLAGIKVEVVPAYNVRNRRDDGQPFHARGVGNGYILTFGDKRIYVAGDTENTPEMQALKDIDVAFLPMNMPYTMTPALVADAARSFRPRVLYPYHFGETDTAKLTALMKDVAGVEVRIRKMK
jgi:L-ascorbate metabolism protein UlaG (beta-lactamase superfamily)